MRYRNPTRFSAAALMVALAMAGQADPVIAQESEEEAELRQEREQAELEMEQLRRELDQARRDLERAERALARAERDRVRGDRVRAPRPPATVVAPFRPFIMGQRGRLGISVSGNQDDNQHRGARVESVVEDGPADAAGIEEGDVITEIDGQALFEPIDDNAAERRIDLDMSVPVQRLLAVVSRLEPGETVEVTYERDGAENTVDVVTADVGPTLAWRGEDGFPVRVDPFVRHRDHDFEWDGDVRFDADRLREQIEIKIRPRIEELRRRGHRRHDGFDSAPLNWVGGITLAPLNPALGEYFESDRGALVLEADDETSLNLLSGDVLLAIDGREVASAADARRILSSYRNGEPIDLLIVRRGEEMTIQGAMQ